MPVLKSTQNLLWRRWIKHSQQYMKTRMSSWNLAYAEGSTYQNFTPLSTISPQSTHMGPLMATTQSLRSVFISILRRHLSGQVTNGTTWCKWQLGWPVMTRFGITKRSYARQKEKVLSKKMAIITRLSERGNSGERKMMMLR